MVLVAGTGMTAFNRRKDGSGFRDWAEEALREALVSAKLGRGDIDALVVASESDFFSMQLNPASVLADDIGLAGAACQRVEGGGASGQLAVHAGVAMVLSGSARRVAVVGFEPSASYLSGAAVSELYGYSFDAWTDGMTGISATALYALSAKAFMARCGANHDDFSVISVQNRENARDNPKAHLPLEITQEEVRESLMVSDPYRRLDCSPLSDGAAAIILTDPNAAPADRKNAARIAGIGAANDRVRLGDREDPGLFKAKQVAAKRAYALAGISEPARQIDLAEIYDAYSGAQLQAIEALGLSNDFLKEHRSGGFSPSGRLPVNLSGGLMGQGAPVGATGVAQVAACAQQIEGTYHTGLQMRKPPRHAVADTHGGIATTCAVTVLEGSGN
ncbi:thiolase family protein [Hoeflea sp. TYP-13]|uniref:thiolase family protein n=1 Tax=Hoeflea sp. TYP-13 TaxID=3230023 RepID=UPI0034C61BF2